MTNETRKIRFQFHYGTIKRERANPSTFNVDYFNSTMVRLKVISDFGSDVIFVFQFHYGTIKRNAWIWFRKDIRNFNSTMVRLKDLVVKDTGEILGTFQFHYGTIKRGIILQAN